MGYPPSSSFSSQGMEGDASVSVSVSVSWFECTPTGRPVCTLHLPVYGHGEHERLCYHICQGLRMRRRHQKNARQQKQRAAGDCTERSLMDCSVPSPLRGGEVRYQCPRADSRRTSRQGFPAVQTGRRWWWWRELVVRIIIGSIPRCC